MVHDGSRFMWFMILMMDIAAFKSAHKIGCGDFDPPVLRKADYASRSNTFRFQNSQFEILCSLKKKMWAAVCVHHSSRGFLSPAGDGLKVKVTCGTLWYLDWEAWAPLLCVRSPGNPKMFWALNVLHVGMPKDHRMDRAESIEKPTLKTQNMFLGLNIR